MEEEAQIGQPQEVQINKLIHLPPLTKYKLFTDQKHNLEQLQKQSPTIARPLTELYDQLSNQQGYDYQISKNYHYAFPHSTFEDNQQNKELPLIQFVNHAKVQQNTFRDRLTKEQMNQISKNGTFLVPSSISAIPYKWQINPVIFKGYQINLQHWYENIAASYHQLRQIGKRINGQTLSIMLNLYELRYYPKRILNLLVGMKQMVVDIMPDYGRVIETQFMLKKYYEFYQKQNHELYQHLYTPLACHPRNSEQQIWVRDRQKYYQNQVAKLKQTQEALEREWPAKQRAIVKKYKETHQTPIQQELEQIVKNQKLNEYHQMLKKDVPKKLQQQVFEFLRIFMTIQLLNNNKEKKISEITERQKQKIKIKYRIRSLSRYFMSEELERVMEPIRKQIQEEYERELEKSLKSQMYTEYLKFKRQYNDKLRSLQTSMPIKYKPSRIFYSTYKLFPPYELKRLENGTYTLIKQRQIQVDTSHHFWKFQLYKMRVYSWTINLFFYTIAMAWVGPFGLKVLLTWTTFKVEQFANYQTGEIHYSYQDSVYQKFRKVWQGIVNSRARFEELPDTGFFGKNFSRIFSYIECYVFRLLFVGIFIILILYPILIVLNSVICFLLAITSWFWTPVCLIITYLFNLLIYQFEIDTNDTRRYERGSEKWFPLINTPLMAVLNLVRVVFYAVSAIILHPLVATIFTLIAIIRITLRTIGDFLMYQIFKLLARTPARDTKIAWKISGPGLSRQYYQAIKEQDIYILVLANLERTYLQKFDELVRKKINDPVAKHTKFMNKIVRVLNCSYNGNTNIIMQASNLLSKRFDEQKKRYMYRYPPNFSSRNVRFTNQELEVYYQNSFRIIKNWVVKRNCEKWFFGRYSIDSGDYEALNKSIWVSLFGQAIFEPFEDLDMRFQLKSNKRTDKIQAIMRAIEGQVQLSKCVPTTTKNYKTINVGHIQIMKLSRVLGNLSNCRQFSIPNSYSDIYYFSMINTNVKELIEEEKKHERYDRFSFIR